MPALPSESHKTVPLRASPLPGPGSRPDPGPAPLSWRPTSLGAVQMNPGWDSGHSSAKHSFTHSVPLGAGHSPLWASVSPQTERVGLASEVPAFQVQPGRWGRVRAQSSGENRLLLL